MNANYDHLQIVKAMTMENLAESPEETEAVLLEDIFSKYDEHDAAIAYEAYLIGVNQPKDKSSVLLDNGVIGEKQKKIMQELKKLNYWQLEQALRFCVNIQK